MPCIMCIAVIAAVSFGVGVGVEEWMASKLSRIAEAGEVTHETGSVATYRGEFGATLDDGTTKRVSATIRLYKESNRVSVQIDDHSLSRDEAERLEDEVCEALGATITERRWPPGGPEALEADHEHADVDEQGIAGEAHELRSRATDHERRPSGHRK